MAASPRFAWLRCWLAALSLTSWACSEQRIVQTVRQGGSPVDQEQFPVCTELSCQETDRGAAENGPDLAAEAQTIPGASAAGTAAMNDAGLGRPPQGNSMAVPDSSTQPTRPALEAQPGEAGLGDPDFTDYGNSGYDVTHYDIQLRYTPSEDRLVGTTTVTLTPTMPLSRFNFDFVLAVSDVTIAGSKAQFTREDQHELVITPPAPLPAGVSIDVVVKYDDIPSRVRVDGIRRAPWWRTSDGAIGAGAPENAWWWFPSNDHPLDKATYDVSVTVPEGVTVISNGVQPVPPTAAKPGWVTWTWQSSYPQQSYLALLAIGDYELVESETKSGMPMIFAYSRRVDTQAARSIVERTAEIAAWQESLFGPYPFEALGAVVSPNDGISYALETQTRPIYPVGYFGPRGAGTSVIAHELAHQWYGDSASLKYWRDVWMSEGFATYTEWMYSEVQGSGTAQEIFDATYNRYPPNDAFWQMVIGNPGKERLWDLAVYNRGAMTLHQLRTIVGDDKFFEILRTWASERRLANGSTEDFRLLSERLVGQSLAEFFDAWLFTPGRPKLATVNSNTSSALPQSSSFAPPLPRSWAAINATQQLHRPLPAASAR